MKDNGTLRPEETRCATELLRAVLRETENDAQKAFELLRGPLRAHSCARSSSRILARATRVRGVTHVDYAGRGSFSARPPEMRIVGVDGEYQRIFEYQIAGTMNDDQLKAEYTSLIGQHPMLKLIRLVNSLGRAIAIYPAISGTAPIANLRAAAPAESAA